MNKEKKLKSQVAFSKDYWDENYKEPDTIDGICNAKDHALYLKHYLAVEGIEINSIIDFGFGLGYLFKEMIKVFKPYKSLGIEPSEHAFLNHKIPASYDGKYTNIQFKNTDLKSFCEEVAFKNKKTYYDLGICTSVFQYLSEDDIKFCLPHISRMVKYLYFSVPTDIELKRQRDDLNYHDQYAFSRPQEFYLEALKPSFYIVSSRVLESKTHFTELNSDLTDLLFRF